MDSILEKYIEALRTNRRAALTDAELDSLAARYPFFVLPFATTASAERDSGRRQRLMQRVALTAADPDMLFRLTDPDGPRFARFYPDQTPDTPDTDSAIDTFLNTYGHRDPREEALLERLIFNPVGDYSAFLEKEAAAETNPAEAPAGSQDAMLDAFLSTQQHKTPAFTSAADMPQQPPAPRKPAAPAAGQSLNESLARIYISRGRYDKAYEIIRQLSLEFPKKSIYFADQLRFLKKLMRNQQYLNNRKQ